MNEKLRLLNSPDDLEFIDVVASKLVDEQSDVDSAPRLSAELIELLRLSNEERVGIRSCEWTAHIYLASEELAATHLMPSAVHFFTQPLRDRFATLSRKDGTALAGFLVTDNGEQNRALVAKVAVELASCLGFNEATVQGWSIDHTGADAQPRALRAVPQS